MNRLGGALLLVTLVASASSARAQTITHSDTERFRTPKRFAFELRFSPYSPDVDDEFKGARTPHKDYFGNDARLMFQIELDYQIVVNYGSAAIGLAAGYFHETATAKIETGAGQPVVDDSGDKTKLTLIPTSLLFVYRADQLWRRFSIPLVPYGKIGLNYTMWRVLDGNGDIARSSFGGGDGRGRGGTLGWQAAAGLSLVLDIVDRGSARQLDSDIGINHTHLFFELSKYDVSGLGQSGKMHLGDTTWTAGLMFEF